MQYYISYIDQRTLHQQH